MSNKTKQGHFTPEWIWEKQNQILAFLREPGAVPLIALAAEKAGVNRNTVATWIHTGDINPDHAIYGSFATKVRQIRADWMANKARSLAEGGLHPNRIKTTLWLLERVDQSLFDLPKPQQGQGPGRGTEAPPKPSSAKAAKAAEALETPEPDRPETLQ